VRRGLSVCFEQARRRVTFEKNEEIASRLKEVGGFLIANCRLSIADLSKQDRWLTTKALRHYSSKRFNSVLVVTRQLAIGNWQ